MTFCFSVFLVVSRHGWYITALLCALFTLMWSLNSSRKSVLEWYSYWYNRYTCLPVSKHAMTYFCLHLAGDRHLGLSFLAQSHTFLFKLFCMFLSDQLTFQLCITMLWEHTISFTVFLGYLLPLFFMYFFPNEVLNLDGCVFWGFMYSNI